MHGLELWLRSLGFYKLNKGGTICSLDSEKLLAMQSMGSAFYFARLRKHAPRLCKFSFASTYGLESAIEQNFLSAGIGSVPAMSATRRLLIMGWRYWDELFSKKLRKNALEREFEREL